MRAAVSTERQQELVAGIMRVSRDAGPPQPYRYGFEKLAAVVPGPAQRYAAWADVPGRLAEEAEPLRARARQASERVPESYEVAAVELLGYRHGSSLSPHVDCVPGWSLIVSLGATARFYYAVGDRSGPRQTVLLQSGDAVAFPTSHADGVWHGIEGFEERSEPAWFTAAAAPYARLCLQFRSSYYHLH